ncbi:MAG: hypothetical protein M3R27_15025 [Bacteroidota bacterium]|nr:hypothetical protein [Bacteroidota bacterium]
MKKKIDLKPILAWFVLSLTLISCSGDPANNGKLNNGAEDVPADNTRTTGIENTATDSTGMQPVHPPK